MKRTRKIPKKVSLLVLLVYFLIQASTVYAEEEYHHVLTLESPDPEKSAWYGYLVEISGNIMVISEPFANVDDVPDAGKVYIYDVDGTLLSTLQSPAPGSVDEFGRRLDLHGDTVIIGEYTDIIYI